MQEDRTGKKIRLALSIKSFCLYYVLCRVMRCLEDCQEILQGGEMRAGKFLCGQLLLWYLASLLMLSGNYGAQPPEKQALPEEPKKLNDLIEKSVAWHDVF